MKAFNNDETHFRKIDDDWSTFKSFKITIDKIVEDVNWFWQHEKIELT